MYHVKKNISGFEIIVSARVVTTTLSVCHAGNEPAVRLHAGMRAFICFHECVWTFAIDACVLTENACRVLVHVFKYI